MILGPRGEVRYVVAKNILNAERLERQRRFLSGAGARYWVESGGRLRPSRMLFGLLHDG